MLLAGVLVTMFAYVRYPKHRFVVMPLLLIISAVDLTFFASNSLRAVDDGWVPLAVAAVVCLLMYTWRDGRKNLNWEVARRQMPLPEFLRILAERPPAAHARHRRLSHERGKHHSHLPSCST